MLSFEDKWVWDSWYAKEGEIHHVFFLQADKALKDPELRHWNARMGHAVSSSLVDWKVLSDPIVPAGDAEPGAHDSQATWTGSVLKQHNHWYMFYTGISLQEHGRKQRICCARSTDLLNWEKVALSGVVEADSRWYEKLEDGVEQFEAWRDPWVHYDERAQTFYMYITARGKTGPVDGRGVIGLARSKNLLDWEVLPPVTGSGPYGEMEVPQIIPVDDQYLLVFCTMKHRVSSARLAGNPGNFLSGMRCYKGRSLTGMFRPGEDDRLLADEAGTYFAARLVEYASGDWRLMAFLNFDEDGEFVGAIGDPIKVDLLPSGEIVLQELLDLKT